jgi:type II secretory pathway component PulF
MLYHYLASDLENKIVEDDFEADSLTKVLEYMATRGLRPISVKLARERGGRFKNIFGSISIADKVFLTKYLSLMLRVGTDLLSAINILIADFDKPAVRNLLLEMRDNLSKGRPFYQVFANYPKFFSPVFVSLIKAAESSGNLQKTFDELSTSLEKEAELRGRIKGALTYPVILFVASMLILIFLVTFAVPKIAAVFLQGDINPPAFSRIVFGVGLFVGGHVYAIFGTLIILTIFFLYFFFKNRIGKQLGQRILNSTPLVKKIRRDIAIQRFAATMSSLMKAGLPIIDATVLTADVVGHQDFKAGLLRIANEGLAKGLTIGDAFKRETVFPKTVSNLVAVSEKAGHLDEVLGTLSDFYEGSVDANIKTMVSFLEPVLLLGMGVIVATIALAIIVPIYQLTSTF